MTENQVPEEPGAVKNKDPVVQNKIHSTKNKLGGKSSPECDLARKKTGIQLKSGAVFCLPAKSSHSSRIIIPNKRFLEDEVEVSPKKPKVEHSSADGKKASTVSVPSTYRCSSVSKKQLKSDTGGSASEVQHKPDIKALLCESVETKRCTSDVDEQDMKSGSEDDKFASYIAQTVESDSLVNKSLMESSTNITVTSVSSLGTAAGSILQRPKLCLDQKAVDRSKLAFAKSLRTKMAQETSSELSNSTLHADHLACPLPATEDVADTQVHIANTSTHSSNIMPSVASISCKSNAG